ncbi:hypothetical protein FISHEDRAFT_39601 [Fistulina hepatica ATCC 64428]|uniref:Uncharacterized protein n=1 Tax=Fistulina hepatica ATCC 64428 TaxID=1128425 RepID=A0A0D7AIM1_9AGAR|nr:hypothetical protein FISHEDRAFT_39601 [Fistulina hepatica ATCC 64428]
MACLQEGRTRTQSNTTLSDEIIQNAFHSYLKSSLTQAQAERLIDAQMLSSAKNDTLMIIGPSLCLFFSALRCTTDPPSIPLPRPKKARHQMPDCSSNAPIDLSFENCPPQFIAFLRVWASTVPTIQSLVPQMQHDLARILCNMPPISSNSRRIDIIRGVAEDIRAVAIEISQRRSFQDRYAEDLQAAIIAGSTFSIPLKPAFKPPPDYNEATSPASISNHRLSASSSRHHSRSRPQGPLLTPEANSSIAVIRETLYSAMLDVISPVPNETNPPFLRKLRSMLKRDPPRAYYTVVALAILHFARVGIIPESGVVIGVLGTLLTLEDCPQSLRPLMSSLIDIAKTVKLFEQEDDEKMACRLQEGGEVSYDLFRMNRVQRILESGIGARGPSPTGRTLALANEINMLALHMSGLDAFRERAGAVFAVLVGL